MFCPQKKKKEAFPGYSVTDTRLNNLLFWSFCLSIRPSVRPSSGPSAPNPEFSSCHFVIMSSSLSFCHHVTLFIISLRGCQFVFTPLVATFFLIKSSCFSFCHYVIFFVFLSSCFLHCHYLIDSHFVIPPPAVAWFFIMSSSLSFCYHFVFFISLLFKYGNGCRQD